MTPLPFPRPQGLLGRGALVALVLAGCAGTAASQDRASATAPARTAVLAGSDAAPSAISAAVGPFDSDVAVRHTSGTLDAQAQALRLAAEGYDDIVAVGAEARAAVAQAAGGEAGDAHTVWRTR